METTRPQHSKGLQIGLLQLLFCISICGALIAWLAPPPQPAFQYVSDSTMALQMVVRVVYVPFTRSWGGFSITLHNQSSLPLTNCTLVLEREFSLPLTKLYSRVRTTPHTGTISPGESIYIPYHFDYVDFALNSKGESFGYKFLPTTIEVRSTEAAKEWTLRAPAPNPN